MTKILTQLYRIRAYALAAYGKFLPRARHLIAVVRHTCTPKRLLYAAGGVFLTLSASYAVTFYWPRTIQFSYSGKNCFANPTLLPNLTSKANSKSFAIDQPDSLSVGGYPVYSHRSCVTAVAAPKGGTSENLSLKLPGNPLFEKEITVRNTSVPAIEARSADAKPVSTKDPLVFVLNTADEVFEYRLEAEGRTAVCKSSGRSLSCDTPALGLAQGTTYDFTVRRMFNKKPVGTAFKQALATVEPIQIVGSSISSGQLVYAAPGEMQLTLNKPAASLESVHLESVAGDKRENLPVTTETRDTTVTIRFAQPLPRSASLELTIGDVTAHDGGYLVAPFTLPFQTSGGPKVRGVSIGSSRVQSGASIVLTFDTGFAAGQNVVNFVRIEANGTVASSVSVSGNKVTIKPAGLGRCTPFTVIVADGLKNEFGISGNSAWQFKSRILCQTVFSIGTSVQGRSITAYRFGDGPDKIIFVGGTHGDEKSSVQILNRWIDQLEGNPTRIPAHRTIIIIPTLNPDGYAANRRTNAHNVDLNRNFPSNSWKSGVTMPDKSYLEYGGGTEPLSEPESRALANYVLGQSPRLVLTYHAAGSVVVPNGSGDSDPIAVQYGKKSSVGYMSNSQTGTFFEYDTTGAFEDWLHDKHGIPALLIELTSRTSNDYSGHQNALWYIAGL